MDRRILLVAVLLSAVSFALLSLGLEDQLSDVSDTGVNFTIGLMSTTDRSYPVDAFFAYLAIVEINQFFDDQSIPMRFTLTQRCVEFRTENAIEITDEFHELGIDIVVGYNMGSSMDACDYQAKNYGMIMISPYGTSSLHRNVYHHQFRLTPVDIHQTDAIAAAIIGLGFNETVVLRETSRGWDDYVIEEFSENFSHLGGEIIDTVRYPNSDDPYSFIKPLTRLGHALNGTSACVFIPSYSIRPVILQSLRDHPILLNFTWFATDNVSSNSTASISVYPELSKIKLIHPFLDQTPDTSNQVYQRVNTLYRQEFGKNMTRYTGNVYDSIWLAALTMMETGEYDNETFIEAFPAVARGYRGISGNCTFDQYGDRLVGNYHILQYVKHGWDVYTKKIGFYDWENGAVEWKP